MRAPSSPTVSNLLTLFPKFFSSFLCSTCSLSVSHRSLALEGVYLPLRAEIPNNPTRRSPSSSSHVSPTGLSPSLARLSRRLRPRNCSGATPSVYNSTVPGAADFKLGLLPLRSPLLRQSLLFSFPPLSDMLKFSGWSCLTSDTDGSKGGRAQPLPASAQMHTRKETCRRGRRLERGGLRATREWASRVKRH